VFYLTATIKFSSQPLLSFSVHPAQNCF